MAGKTEKIVLGGGCFWCTEAVFQNVDGVVAITPGYSGGTTADPEYPEVYSGSTGHAEVARVEYDPGNVSLETLLDVFFSTHDPTTPDRQGNDVGSQYRSIIFYDSEGQGERVEAFIAGIRPDYERPVVTEVKPLDVFYPAEEYHQDYYVKNPEHGYCQVVIAPKVDKLRKKLGKT